MKAIFNKCYDDYGNLKDNALNIAFNLGKKEGLRKGIKQGRADEQIQSIEDAKKQAAEYLDALDKAKKEAYQQGARKFAEWCIQNNIDFSHCENSDCDNCTRTICRNAQTYTDVVLAEWQKGAEE